MGVLRWYLRLPRMERAGINAIIGICITVAIILAVAGAREMGRL